MLFSLKNIGMSGENRVSLILHDLQIVLQGKQLAALLNEDPAIMQQRTSLSKRLELYRSAQSEIEAVAWDK